MIKGDLCVANVGVMKIAKLTGNVLIVVCQPVTDMLNLDVIGLLFCVKRADQLLVMTLVNDT